MNGEKARAHSGWYALLAGAVAPLVFGGCESMSNTDKGLLGGAGIGAVAGGLLGAAVRRPVAGAAIGAAVGGTTGAVAGNAVDRAEHKAQVEAATAAAAQRVLTLEQIVALTANATSDEVIINQIRTSGAVYNLTFEQLNYLQQNGVHEPVIREMQATAYRAPRYVYAPAPPPVYVYPPPPPPPVGVGVGFSFHGR
jgi:hypothetical protein